MSDRKKKKNRNAAGTQEKVVTRYDLKVQRRQEEKRKEQRNKKIGTAVGILILVGLVCLILSFPIRSWLTVHGTYIVAAGEDVSKVEFDYSYNTVRNNYIAQNSWLSYFGLDLTGDLSTQMYSNTLSWQDFFEQMAVDNLISGTAMRRDMENAGFVYDETEDYEDFVEALTGAAEDAGMPFKDYVREFYGPYATMDRLEKFIRQDLKISAYYEQLAKEKAPSDEEIESYYQENASDYDLVDYSVDTVDAVLPTEPTELADPVEEDAETGESGEDASGEGEEETAYQPSEAEIAFAMRQAKSQAQTKEASVLEEGEQNIGRAKSDINSLLTEWLFDSQREKGDTTVIEDTTNNRYYVLGFEGRYLNPAVTVNVRAIMTSDGNGQDILDQWKAGEATEDSFAELADQYNASMTTEKGGLLEELAVSGLSEELVQWLSDDARAYGDTAVISPEGDTVSYVFYFLKQADPEWKLDIRNILTGEIMETYVTELTEGLTVEDPHGHLAYLKVQEEESEAQESEDSSEESETQESGDSSEEPETQESGDSSVESEDQAQGNDSSQEEEPEESPAE